MQVEGFKSKPFNKPLSLGEFVNYYSEKIYQGTNFIPHQVIIFNSLSDLARCVAENNFIARNGNGTWNDKGYKGCEKESNNYWKFGLDFPDYESTLNALVSGVNDEGMIKMYESAKEALINEYPELFELQNLAFKTRKRRKFSEDGGELDIDRYMSGEPEHWAKSESVKDKKTLKIMLNGSLNGSFDPDEFVNKMAISACFIDIVKTLGLSVEFWYAPVSSNTMTHVEIDVIFAKVKGADEDIDIQRLLSCGLPGLFRYFTFKIEANILSGRPVKGFGRAIYQTPDWIKDMYEFDVCVDFSDDMVDTVRLFIDKIKSIIAK